MPNNGTKHDIQTVLDAIRGEGVFADPTGKAVTSTGGIVTTVARRLGVSRQTVYAYKKRWQRVAQALEDERETILDLTENQLFREIQNGNITAIIFTLKTLGRHRGYIERRELVGTGDKADAIPILLVNMDGEAL